MSGLANCILISKWRSTVVTSSTTFECVGEACLSSTKSCQSKTVLSLDSPFGDIDLVAATEFDRCSVSFHFDGLAVALDHQLNAFFVVADAGSKDLLLSGQVCERNRAVTEGNARIEVCRLIGSSSCVLVVGDEDLERHGGSSIGLRIEELKS